MSRAMGFTLLEMLISVTIIGMLVGVSAPVYESFVRQNDLNLATQGIATMIQRAETYALGNNTDSVWSVELLPASVILFQGTSFASRNTNYDETYPIPGSITLSGLTEIQFAKLTALPNTTGAITLASTTLDTNTITLNAKGVVDY